MDEPLLELLTRLRALNYRFVTVTPATHGRVVARPLVGPPGLRDIFGWSRLFEAADLDPQLLDLLGAAEGLQSDGAALRSKLRIASLDGALFLHSAYPTEAVDAVFFGPDTYRFARFIRSEIPRLGRPPRSIVDMGAGSGAGGIVAAKLVPGAAVTLVDVNPGALRLAEVNAAAAGVRVSLVLDDKLPAADLIVANPPYIIDPAARAYRDGGALLGGAVAADWVSQALERLTPGGTMLLYTGVAVTNGSAPLLRELEQRCVAAGAELTVEELDPDVFGEELEQPAYRDVERIAAMGATIRKRS